MNRQVTSSWSPDRLDVAAMARAHGELLGQDELSTFSRLRAEVADGSEVAGLVVKWQASGEWREESVDEGAPWLHLRAEVALPLTCQRCLGPVMTTLCIDRRFRFVVSEDQAAQEDDDCEEDVLALEPRPNLRELIEDELLMALPLVPMHECCPAPLSAAATVEMQAPVEERPHPFAVLAKLKK